jgi:hypothetical protein
MYANTRPRTIPSARGRKIEARNSESSIMIRTAAIFNLDDIRTEIPSN